MNGEENESVLGFLSAPTLNLSEVKAIVRLRQKTGHKDLTYKLREIMLYRISIGVTVMKKCEHGEETAGDHPASGIIVDEMWAHREHDYYGSVHGCKCQRYPFDPKKQEKGRSGAG